MYQPIAPPADIEAVADEAAAPTPSEISSEVSGKELDLYPAYAVASPFHRGGFEEDGRGGGARAGVDGGRGPDLGRRSSYIFCPQAHGMMRYSSTYNFSATTSIILVPGPFLFLLFFNTKTLTKQLHRSTWG